MQVDYSFAIVINEGYSSRLLWLQLFGQTSNAEDFFIYGFVGIGFHSRGGCAASSKWSSDGVDFPDGSNISI